MKSQWDDADDPMAPKPPDMDWLTQIMSNPLWGGWAGAPGQTNYINPTSSRSPLAGTGVTGTRGAGGGGGIPLGGFGTTSTSGLLPSTQVGTGLGMAPSTTAGISGVGGGAGTGAGMAGLLSGIGAKEWALLAAGVAPQLIGMMRGQGELPYGDQMERLIAELTKQQQEADPLRRAVLSWAQGLVPTRG